MNGLFNAFTKFILFAVVLFILDFIFFVRPLIVGLSYFYAYPYIMGIILIVTSKIMFDIEFHKIQKKLERKK